MSNKTNIEPFPSRADKRAERSAASPRKERQERPSQGRLPAASPHCRQARTEAGGGAKSPSARAPGGENRSQGESRGENSPQPERRETRTYRGGESGDPPQPEHRAEARGALREEPALTDCGEQPAPFPAGAAEGRTRSRTEPGRQRAGAPAKRGLRQAASPELMRTAPGHHPRRAVKVTGAAPSWGGSPRVGSSALSRLRLTRAGRSPLSRSLWAGHKAGTAPCHAAGRQPAERHSPV